MDYINGIKRDILNAPAWACSGEGIRGIPGVKVIDDRTVTLNYTGTTVQILYTLSLPSDNRIIVSFATLLNDDGTTTGNLLGSMAIMGMQQVYMQKFWYRRTSKNYASYTISGYAFDLQRGDDNTVDVFIRGHGRYFTNIIGDYRIIVMAISPFNTSFNSKCVGLKSVFDTTYELDKTTTGTQVIEETQFNPSRYKAWFTCAYYQDQSTSITGRLYCSVELRTCAQMAEQGTTGGNALMSLYMEDDEYHLTNKLDYGIHITDDNSALQMGCASSGYITSIVGNYRVLSIALV